METTYITTAKSSQDSSFLTQIRSVTTPAHELPAVIVKNTGGRRGRGVFATRALPRRHQVIVETPALSCIHWSMRRGRRNIANVWIKLSQERKQELQQYFRKLKGISTTGEKLTRLDRLRLRRFIEEYAFWDTGGSNAHVYRLASHMNHACSSCANAEQYTEMASPNAIAVALVRAVRANEEILIDYNRRSSLKCSVCQPSETRELLNALGEGMSRLSCSLLIDQALRRDNADNFPSVAPRSIV
jgi:hypothetical protein